MSCTNEHLIYFDATLTLYICSFGQVCMNTKYNNYLFLDLEKLKQIKAFDSYWNW